MSEPIEGNGIVWAQNEIFRLLNIGLEKDLSNGGDVTSTPNTGGRSQPMGNIAQSEATEPPRGRPAEISGSNAAADPAPDPNTSGFETDLGTQPDEMPITEPRPVSTSLAVAKRVEASEGPERAGNKPLMRNPQAKDEAAPIGDTASDTFHNTSGLELQPPTFSPDLYED